jgi:hypothetical protein
MVRHADRTSRAVPLEPITPALLDEVRKAIVEAIAPDRIILFFGSARSRPTTLSVLPHCFMVAPPLSCLTYTILLHFSIAYGKLRLDLV